jgi:hypothetical protein
LAALAAAAALCGCTQETQNQIGRAVQNSTGTNGALHIYAGDKLGMRFIRLGKLSTALAPAIARRAPIASAIVTWTATRTATWTRRRKLYFEISAFATSCAL